jgi:hypothetical protein
MKKLSLLALVIAAGTALLFGGVLTAADVPDEVVINNEGYSSDRKGPVALSHKKHVEEYGVTCEECHHVYEDGENVWKEGCPVQACSECHDYEKSEGNAMKLNFAYHRNCQGCHKEAYKEGNKNAPVRNCNDCHE